MPANEKLLARIRKLITNNPAITEKKMFGGAAFLLQGNLLIGVWQDSLIVRLGIEDGAKALTEPHVRPFDLTGKAMKGWAMVDSPGFATEKELEGWILRTTKFVRTLPPKKGK